MLERWAMKGDETEDISYIGKQVGNYRISASINSGAFGHVYKGAHLYLSNRIVAIKILHTTYLESDKERASFLREAQFLEMLKHEHILPIYDVGIDDEGFPYLVAEFAPNGSLRDHMEQNRKLLPLSEMLRVLTQVGQGLQYVHEQNIVHRDLKPENILFDAKNDALIADFGIAVFLENTRTKFVNVIGSPLYMAPEQFEGAASRRSDQYALACIAYELLTGHPPFVAKHAVTLGRMHQSEPPRPPSEINPDIPAHIERAILKALEKNREDRYPDILFFIDALLKAHASAHQAPVSPYQIPASTRHKTSDHWLDEGNRLFNASRYADALVAFERAIQADADFVAAYEGKGSALYALGRTDEALAMYERAIHLDSTYALAYVGKGNILYDQRHHDQALKYYERALQLDPDLADAYQGKGNVLYSLGRYEEAVLAHEEALQRDPTCLAAYDGIGWALRRLGRYREALDIYNRLLEQDPDYAPAYSGKGRTLYRLERYREALACFERAIQLAPDLAQTYEFKADTLYHMRRYEEALTAYEQALALNPESAEVFDGRAWVLWRLKRPQEALASFDEAIYVRPDAASPYNGKGSLLYELKRYREALAAFDHALRLNPHLASAYNGKGNVLFNLRHYEEALAAYEHAIKLQPRMGAFHYNRADTLKQLGRTAEAHKEYELARQLGYIGS